MSGQQLTNSLKGDYKMPATQKRVVKKATVPFKGKMKQVIREEAWLLSLISGYLVREGPIQKYADEADDSKTVLVCKGPGHCAMGALMYAAGISNKRISEFKDEGTLGTYEEGPIARKLFDTYHLDATDASTIISGNDGAGGNSALTVDEHKASVRNRMEQVLSTIDSLSKRTRLRPSARVESF
jgi:hypothetical protein